MSKHRFRLPSPALVISMVALAVVLGGTAVAATVGPHDDAKADKALIQKLAPTLSVKNANRLGGQPAASFEPKNAIMWAVVTNDGVTATVDRSSGGITVSRGGTGYVHVTFPQDVSNCAWIATQGFPASSLSDVPADFATVRGNGNANDVAVATYDTTGTQVDDAFHILVTC